MVATAQRGSCRILNAIAAPAACSVCVAIGTHHGKSARGPEKSLPRSSPPQYSRISRIVTPRHSWVPTSRYTGASTSSARIAAPIPMWVASWPRQDA